MQPVHINRILRKTNESVTYWGGGGYLRFLEWGKKFDILWLGAGL
jgi:hypothetical protein